MKGQKIMWIDLRNLRQMRGWRQQEAADKLGISRSYLSAIENRKRSVSINSMESIIKVFGVKYEDFKRVDLNGGEKHD